jgi:23S rRNA pseudouridine2605 synthase
MARRHEDRGPGERLARGPRRGQREGFGPGPFAGKRRGPSGRRRGRGLAVEPLPVATPEDDGKVRLNRFLAMAGVCSRRAADGVIAGGRVQVNGTVMRELGVRVDPKVDEVAVDGKPLQKERPVYVLFNKPAGVVCTNARHEQKKKAIDFLPQVRGRVYTVGRLDMDSEGLILLTNDGDFAMKMTHPRFGVPKIYSVEIRGRLDQTALHKARGGVWLSEGPTTGMRIKVESANPRRTFMKVLLREGRNREIRRVFAKLGFPVTSLKRIRIGDLTLHGLGEGKWRHLLPEEVRGLIRVALQKDDEGDHA